MASSDKFFLVIEADDPKFERRRHAVPARHGREGSVRRCGLTRSRLALLFAPTAARSRGCRQDMHDAPRYEAVRGELDVSPTTAPRARRRPARWRAAGCATTRRSTPARSNGAARRRIPVRDRPRRAGARPAALQHLLHAVPRTARRRQRHGRAARPAPGRVVSPGSPAPGEGRLLLRRDHQRLRRHAGLRGTDSGPRSLADRRLRAHAATEPARVGRRTCRRIAAARSTRENQRPPPPVLRRARAATRRSRRRNTSVDDDCDFGNLTRRPARRCRACGSSA